MTLRGLFNAVKKVDFEAATRLYAQRIDPHALLEAETPSEALLSAFRWKTSEEGFGFWNEVYEKLKKVEEYELLESA